MEWAGLTGNDDWLTRLYALFSPGRHASCQVLQTETVLVGDQKCINWLRGPSGFLLSVLYVFSLHLAHGMYRARQHLIMRYQLAYLDLL